jgi:hypothetical protein
MNDSQLTLETFFLHKKLVRSLLPKSMQRTLETEVMHYENSGSPSADLFMSEVYKEHLEQFLRKNHIPSLEEQLANSSLQMGQLVWTKRTFQFKGSIKALGQFEKYKKPSYGSFYSIDSAPDDRIIKGNFNVEHFTCSSSTGILTGKVNHFVLGYIADLNKKEINLRPIAIGKSIYNIGAIPLPSQNILECCPDDIEEFSKIDKVSPRFAYPNIEVGRGIPEERMKSWIGELIGVTEVPKDWPGEKSDLLLPVHYKGQRMMAAFLLKGPAKFHELRIKDLGANGDQLVRFFEEPARLCVLVHCHKVSSAVRKNMEIFSTNFYNPRHFCIIDGYDLLRIWKAYGKVPASTFAKAQNSISRASSSNPT